MQWLPSHMFILHQVDGRVAAGFVEAALIEHLNNADYPIDDNVNSQRKHRGGTGPRKPELEQAKYYIYLVVSPTGD